MDILNNVKVQNLVEDLKLIVRSTESPMSNFPDNIFQLEIKNALLEYYNDRHYVPTEDKPYEDIYAGIIIQLANSSLNKYGIEGENYHSEGGIIRTYDSSSNYPLALTKKIVPLAKGVDL